ncbi:MAG: hypothetical protein ABI851_10695 [Saprospiraceae bacterium]
MGKYIISILLSFSSLISNGQTMTWKLKDSIAYSVNELYIDRLNQIYLFPKNEHVLIKLNEDLSINQEYSSPFISQFVFMDVKNPMKVLMYLPQFSNVNVLDESLTILSEEYFSDFNNESSICYFSANQLCYYSKNKINIRDLQNRNLKSSEPILYKQRVETEISQIKSNGQDIFLLLPKTGLWHFNSFLNLESYVEDYEIKRIELMDNELYLLKNDNISIWKPTELSDQILFASKKQKIYSFAINKKYLLIALDNKILRYNLSN